MIKIQYNFSESCYDYSKNSVRISPDEHNNLIVDPSTGMITMKAIPEMTPNELNTPGNGIDGEVSGSGEDDKKLKIVRLNNSVTRKQSGDPTPENEGIILPDLLDQYFESLGV